MEIELTKENYDGEVIKSNMPVIYKQSNDNIIIVGTTVKSRCARLMLTIKASLPLKMLLFQYRL